MASMLLLCLSLSHKRGVVAGMVVCDKGAVRGSCLPVVGLKLLVYEASSY